MDAEKRSFTSFFFFLDAVKRFSDVQTYGAAATLFQQLINASSRGR